MSRSLRLTVGGIAVVLLAACGGDGGESAGEPATTQGAAAGSASGTATGSADEDFCTRAAGIDDRVEEALQDLGDDASLTDAFAEISADLRGIEPPEAIAADWAALADGLDRLGAALADVDVTDPGSLSALEQVESDLSGASDRVDAYLRDECGIE